MGALYIRKGIKVASEAHGGPQEHNLRAGTENVAGIVGLGAAAAVLETERQERYDKAAVLKKYMYKHLIAANNNFRLNGTMEHALPNILDFSIAGIDNAILLIALDMQGIAVSAGSACEAGAVEPSHVLQAMGIADAWAKGSIRVSFGTGNNIEQIKSAVTAIKQTADDIMRKEKICE